MTDRPNFYTLMAEALQVPRAAAKLACYMGTPESNPYMDTMELRKMLEDTGSDLKPDDLRRVAFGWLMANIDQLPKPTPEQAKAATLSFAYGNAAVDNPKVTREMVQEAWDNMQPDTQQAIIESATTKDN